MNRSAKGFRAVSSIFILLNLAVFFQPVTVRVQENYAALDWSQLEYIKGLFMGGVPFGDHVTVKISAVQTIWIIFLMAVPVIFSMKLQADRQQYSHISCLRVIYRYVLLCQYSMA